MNKNKTLRWLPVALLAASSMNAMAQTDTTTTVPSQPIPEMEYKEEKQTYILGGLVVDGVKGYDEDLLRDISGLTIGEAYEVPGSDITVALRRYWSQGLFSNVTVETDSIVGNKIYLHIRLTAQPRISSIIYHGVKKTEREDLEKRLGLKEGNQITPDMIDRAKILVKRYFEEKGFKNAEVEILQRNDVTGDNKVLVDININKSAKVKVRHIYISGVTEKEAKKLKRAMKKTKEASLPNFLRSKKFLVDKYAEDKGLLIDKLNEWGYRDALIRRDSVATIDSAHVDIHLDLYRGQRYYVRNITWVGNTVYPTAALAQTLGFKKGDVYDQTLLTKRLSQDDDAVGQQYYNNGYVFYNLDPIEINVDGDSIDLEMRLREGQQATFNHVRISGNDRVFDNVIRREIHTKPGDLFSMESIKRTVRELANMNQFDAEALQTELFKNIRPNAESGTVDITYPLVSKGADQVELSAGWGQTGIVGKVGVKFTNFSIQNLFRKGRKRMGIIPMGDGQTLSIQGQTNGTYYQQYSLSFLDPWFGGKRPNQLSVSFFYSKQTDVNGNYENYYNNLLNYRYGYNNSNGYYNYANYYDPDKYMRVYGLSVGFGKRLRWPDDYFTFTASLSYTRYVLKDWRFYYFSNGTSNNLNLNFTLSRSSIDIPFFPRRGSEFELSATFTPPYSLWSGKDYRNLATNSASATYENELQEKFRWIEYHKWKFKLRTFTALTKGAKPLVLMTRVETGILGAYNRYNRSPFETYYVGGDGMSGTTGYGTETIGLRGYENGALAGAFSSNAYAYSRMTLELRYPLMLEGSTNLYALAFVEGGNAWQNVKDYNPFNMKRSAGIGVRVMLPMVGLLGIDWAYGFQKYNGTQKIGGSQFHFLIGQEF